MQLQHRIYIGCQTLMHTGYIYLSSLVAFYNRAWRGARSASRPLASLHGEHAVTHSPWCAHCCCCCCCCCCWRPPRNPLAQFGMAQSMGARARTRLDPCGNLGWGTRRPDRRNSRCSGQDRSSRRSGGGCGSGGQRAKQSGSGCTWARFIALAPLEARSLRVCGRAISEPSSVSRSSHITSSRLGR